MQTGSGEQRRSTADSELFEEADKRLKNTTKIITALNHLLAEADIHKKGNTTLIFAGTAEFDELMTALDEGKP